MAGDESIPQAVERQITFAPHGHILTNTAVFSPDGRWVVYDVRSDLAGDVFDSERIEMVNVDTGEIWPLYRSERGARCGVATWDTQHARVVFILGPEKPTPDFSYAANRRQGVIVDVADPGHPLNLDARDLVSPFTAGALRGGSHVHVFNPDGRLVSFTYQDHVLGQFKDETPAHEVDLRNVGVSVLGKPVRPMHEHPRNHDGIAFSVLVTRTTADPRPGSDDISRAFEEAWVRSDQPHRQSLAFQGHVLTTDGKAISEVFIVDLPDDLTQPGDGPLQGTATHRPAPPKGCVQRRLTYTAGRKHPGIQGPRHWLRSSPVDGGIAFLMKDDDGIVQIWTISPAGGQLRQMTHNPWPIASAFSWSPDGSSIAHVMDNSVCLTDAETGRTHRLTSAEGRADASVGGGGTVSTKASAPRPEACVFSPDGRRIAHVRTVGGWNQVFVLTLSPQLLRTRSP